MKAKVLWVTHAQQKEYIFLPCQMAYILGVHLVTHISECLPTQVNI